MKQHANLKLYFYPLDPLFSPQRGKKVEFKIKTRTWNAWVHLIAEQKEMKYR